MNRRHIARLVDGVGASIPPDGKRDYFRYHRVRFRDTLAAIPADAGRDALEIGMNPGIFTQILVRAGYRVSGTDLFPEHRAELWQRMGVAARRWNIDSELPPYPPGSFDLVFFSEVIEHLANPPLEALATFRELLRPGGYLVITTPNQFYLKSRLRALADILLLRPFDHRADFERWANLRSEARYYTHSRLFTMPQLAWMCQQSGLTPVRRVYSAAYEPIGVEAGRVLRHPARVAAKSAFWAATAALPPARSMLLLVAQRPPEPLVHR